MRVLKQRGAVLRKILEFTQQVSRAIQNLSSNCLAPLKKTLKVGPWIQLDAMVRQDTVELCSEKARLRAFESDHASFFWLMTAPASEKSRHTYDYKRTGTIKGVKRGTRCAIQADQYQFGKVQIFSLSPSAEQKLAKVRWEVQCYW